MKFPDPKIMPIELQIKKLKEIFIKYNPDEDPAKIDWKHEVDPTLSYPEQVLEFKRKFPMYKWVKDEAEAESLRKEAERKLKEDIDFLTFFAETSAPEDVKEEIMRVVEAFEGRAKTNIELRREMAKLSRQMKEREAELARLKEKKIPPPPPRKLSDREVDLLWGDFSAKLVEAKINPELHRGDFYATLDRAKTLDENLTLLERKAKEIIKAAKPPTPPKPPEEEIKRIVREELKRITGIEAPPTVVARRPSFETRKCDHPDHKTQPDRPEEGFMKYYSVDVDKLERMRMILPQSYTTTYYLSCPYHQRKFGEGTPEEKIRDMLVGGMITEFDLAQVGLRKEDFKR